MVKLNSSSFKLSGVFGEALVMFEAMERLCRCGTE